MIQYITSAVLINFSWTLNWAWTKQNLSILSEPTEHSNTRVNTLVNTFTKYVSQHVYKRVLDLIQMQSARGLYKNVKLSASTTRILNN